MVDYFSRWQKGTGCAILPLAGLLLYGGPSRKPFTRHPHPPILRLTTPFRALQSAWHEHLPSADPLYPRFQLCSTSSDPRGWYASVACAQRDAHFSEQPSLSRITGLFTLSASLCEVPDYTSQASWHNDPADPEPPGIPTPRRKAYAGRMDVIRF